MIKISLICKSIFFATLLLAAHTNLRGQERDFEYDAKTGAAWVGMTRSSEHGITFPVTVNGLTATAFLDSGSNGGLFFSISKSLQDKMKFKKIGTQKWDGYGGSGTVDVVLVPEFKMGGFVFRNYPASVRSYNEFDVLVRLESLLSLTLQVEWDRQRLRFLLPGELSNDAANNINYDSDLDFLFVNSEICGQPHKLLLDTGLENAVDLNERFVDIKCANPLRSTQSAIGAGGSVVDDIVGLPFINIAGIRFEGLYAGLEKRGGPLDRRKIAGSIGYGILQRSNFIIDAGSGQIQFYGPLSNKVTPAALTIGIQFTNAKKSLRVSHIMANSPASKTPLQEGDKICRINDTAVSELNNFDDMNPAPGTNLRLQLCGGETIDLVAKNYMAIAAPKPSASISPVTEKVFGQMTEAYKLCRDWEEPNKNLIASCDYAIGAKGMLDYYKSYALLSRGQLLHSDGKFAAAISDFTAFMELNGASVALLRLRAESYLAMKDFTGAISDLKQVLEIESDNADAREALNRIMP